MMKNLIVVFAVLGVALAGRIVREEPKDPLKDFVEDAQKQFDAAKTALNDLFGLDKLKTDDVLGLVKNATSDLTAKLEAARENLDKELKAITNTTVADFYKGVDGKIQETITSLKKQLDESGVTDKASDLQKKLQEGVNTLIEEGKKVADATGAEVNEAQKKLRAQTQSIIDEGVNKLKELQEDLQKRVKE